MCRPCRRAARSSAASSTSSATWSRKALNTPTPGKPEASAWANCCSQWCRARTWPRSWLSTAANSRSVSCWRAPVVTTRRESGPGSDHASGRTFSSTTSRSRRLRAASIDSGNSGARLASWAWRRSRSALAVRTSRVSASTVCTPPAASTAAHSRPQPSASCRPYAASTPCGAPANTRARSSGRAAEAASTSPSAQHSRTATTRHCHTSSASTGSRSTQRARASSRGTRVESSSPSSSRPIRAGIAWAPRVRTERDSALPANLCAGDARWNGFRPASDQRHAHTGVLARGERRHMVRSMANMPMPMVSRQACGSPAVPTARVPAGVRSSRLPAQR